MSSVATVLSNQKLPIQLSGNDIVLLAAITALETIVMTAIMKDYSVEITGETTKEGTDISLKDRQTEFVNKDKIICQENC